MPTVIFVPVFIAAMLGGFLAGRATHGRKRPRASSFAAYLQDTYERGNAAIARELHDEVGGVLAAAKMELDVIGRLVPEETAAVHGRLLRLSATLDTGLRIERRLVERLRPSVLDHLGLYAGLRWQVSEQCATAGSTCAFSVHGSEPDCQPEIAIIVLRSVADIMAYVLAQHDFTAVEVEVRTTDRVLEVLVQNDGAPGPESSASKEPGVRIWAASRRASMLGGECTVSPRTPRGTRILLRVPMAGDR